MGTAFSAFKEQLNFRLGNRADPTVTGELRVPQMLPIWVNAAYHDLSTKLRFPEFEESSTLVANGADAQHPRYLLPTNYFSLHSLRDTTNDNLLKKIPIRQLREKTSDAVTIPVSYALWRLEIVLEPPLTTATSITLQLDYRKRPDLLVVDSNESVLTLDWDEVIVTGAEYRALNDIGGPMKDEAAKAKALYNAMIAERLDRLAEEMAAELNNTAVADKVTRESTWG